MSRLALALVLAFVVLKVDSADPNQVLASLHEKMAGCEIIHWIYANGFGKQELNIPGATGCNGCLIS